MLKLESESLIFSEDVFVIGGTRYYVYNASTLEDLVKSFDDNCDSQTEIIINVLYLVHQREGDFTYTKAIGKNIIHQFQELSSAPLIAVTMDSRNHGARTVDPSRNASWDEGNKTHGADMISCIRGDVYDIKTAIDFLPAFLNLESHLKTRLQKIRYRNILSGYSAGAHSIIRIANRYPDLVEIANPNVGCANLTSLLINRLKGTEDFSNRFFDYKYDELGLTDAQKEKYPEHLHETISAEDTELAEKFPFEKVKVFASFYRDDPIVPSRISDPWVELLLRQNKNSQAFYEEGAVHDITPSMITKFSIWMANQLE